MKAWLDGWSKWPDGSRPEEGWTDDPPADRPPHLAERIAELEQRIAELEQQRQT
jgi:hypothetical protein